MAVELVQLFNPRRVGDVKTAVILALYLPLGLLITVLRLFIGLQIFIITCVLPTQSLIRRVLLRVMYVILGVVIYSSTLEKAEPTTQVIVANHISVLDHVIIGLIIPCVVPNVWSLPSYLSWALGYTGMGARQGRQVFLDKVRKHCEHNPEPVLAFPEGALTNGNVGLLKFSTWAFSLNRDVQPVVVTVHRPLLNISTHTLGSTLWQDLFWFLFVPVTFFNVRVLPIKKSADFGSADEFSVNVQGAIAEALGVACTSFTSADKAGYVKRAQLQQAGTEPIAVLPPTISEKVAVSQKQNPSVNKMVQQVHEVLPHVPLHVIRKDLETTNSVDATINNILENNTAQTSNEVGSSKCDGNASCASQGTTASGDELAGCDPSTASPPCTKYAAEHFGKSSAERQRSLQERKASLLSSARKRFTERPAARD